MADRARRTSVVTLAAALGMASIGGCASDGPVGRGGPTTTASGSAASTTLVVPGGAVPPATGPELDALVEAVLGPEGWTVSRASLVRDHTPARTPVLSIYARPLNPMDDDTYAATLAPLAAAVIPVLMGRFDGVGAIDLCQVPFEVPADGTEPPPVTRLLIRRPDLAAVPWDGLDLSGLLRVAGTPVAGAGYNIFDLFALPRIRTTATWTAAARAA